MNQPIIPFSYHGGKVSYLSELYQYFPPPKDFKHLVDLFGGSFVVSLNYPRTVIKTANEINERITNFFQVLRDHPDELVAALELTPNSLTEYQRCWESSPDPIEDARRFFVRVRQSMYGLGCQHESKGWYLSKSNSSPKGDGISLWANTVPKLRKIARVIAQNIQVTNLDAIDCIDRLDDKHVFFYVDPPYPSESRSSTNDYQFEMTDDAHRALSERLHRLKGLCMVSGYPCPLMEDLYGDWRRVPLTKRKYTATHRLRPDNKQEMIWMNYDKISKQTSLF